MNTVNLAEGLLKGMIKEAGISPKDILIALHNVCAHGQIIEDIGGEVKDKHLSDLFEGFDKSIDALKKMLD